MNATREHEVEPSEPASGVFDRAHARASVLLMTVLPLVETLSRVRPEIARRVARTPGTVQIEARETDLAARIVLGDGVRVLPGTGHADVRCIFADAPALASFLAGKPALPRLEPAWGLGHARLLVETRRILGELRVLAPPSPRQRAAMTRVERALRVRLLLEVATRALARLHLEGWPPIGDLARGSPDRMFEWTTTEDPSIAARLRIHDGRVKVVRAIDPRVRPFVSFVFPDVDSAFDVITQTSGASRAMRAARVVVHGSPEYARTMTLLMQKVDELLSPA